MGLSSSQARLLNLTARMHDIEYKAQNLEAQKLQMANESTQVYQEYENALNKQKVQFKQIGADGSAKFEDASVQTLIDNGYKIKLLSGGTWYDMIINESGSTKKAVFVASEKFNQTISFNASTSLKNKKAYDSVVYDGSDVNLNGGTTKLTKGTTVVLAAEPLGSTVSAIYLQDKNSEKLNKLDLSDKEVLNNLVEAGFIVFEKPNSDGTYSEVNIATDTSLQEVSDETELKKAEAKYEADMRKIDAKDKKFDTDLAAMEQERNAIKTEMETLKTVAKDNVDRTFKLFS